MSTLFNLKLPLKEKKISQHPWEKTIKYVYSNNIKTAHNSINNPRYPVKREKPVDKDRVRFTIIGNRVTEEFIYCVNLVKGLHTYRNRHFDSPIIRGVTSVEWPVIWNDLKLQYGGLVYCLTSQVAVLINDRILGGEKELKELIDTKYTYHLSLEYCKESIEQFSKFIKGSGRPCAYMHIAIDDEHIGTMLFMLYADIAPFTCENFLRLCKETKGGYSGTPIHRIVKDGWIQCGGFGLKDTKFYCENFIIPPDRRGVLCMANAGRHVECSTQFFILLQPAPWMLHKYVAFGQLIDGESTLQKIEKVEAWYESPTSNILIYRAGVLNLDCQDIMINRGAKEYIQGHIEDLFALGEILIEELMTKVYLEIQFRALARLEMKGEGAETTEEDKLDLNANLHATERFMRKKGSQVQKLLDKSTIDQKSSKVDPRASKADSRSPRSQMDQKLSVMQHSSAISKSDVENLDFDVSMYDYEPEEYSYLHATIPQSESIVVKPEKLYYIPLTDQPYPGEIDSEYDLKRFLRGDYCLESDLEVKNPQKSACIHKAISYPSEIFQTSFESKHSSESSLDSDEEIEIKRYLKFNIDRVSFAGSVIRNIARGVAKHNFFEDGTRKYKSELVTDEELRRFRLASADYRHHDSFTKKVSISVPIEEFKAVHKEIKRRQTGFVRPVDLEKIHIIEKSESDEDSISQRKVRIDPGVVSAMPATKIARRATAFARPGTSSSDMELKRQSVLTRLYEDQQYQYDDELPTLKDYKPMTESTHNNMLLTQSTFIMKSDDKMDHYRPGHAQNSYEKSMNMQHGQKLARKISSDYVKTIDQAQQLHQNSLRSLEFAKIRPSMSVGTYQAKNNKYKETLKKPTPEITSHDAE